MNILQTLRPTLCLTLGAILPFLGACSATKRADVVPIVESEAPAEGPLALDIDNHRGSVTVVVNPKLKGPQITAVVRERGTKSSERWAAASMANDAGRPVLRVLSSPPESGPAPHVDIVIKVPTCAGIRVRSDDGQITLRGVGGAIDAQTSIGGHSPTAILVTTNTPLHDPVLLHAQRGGIELRMAQSSAGQLRAEAPAGGVEVDAATADLRDVRFTRQTWTGTLNAGTSDMRLTADDGDILVLVGR